jgi:hypothetical protein
MELALADPITALCDAVQQLVDAERQNLEAGTHRPGTTGTFQERCARRDERARQRRDAVIALWDLRDAALPACVAAGYRPEVAEIRLDNLIRAVLSLTEWEKGTRPITEASDDIAAANFWASHSRVLTALTPVQDMAHAAAKPPVEQPPAAPSADRPRWDSQRRELHFRGQVVKRYRQPAKNQERILQEFQEAEWPDRIDDPLPGDSNDPHQRLADAIRGLNDNDAIRFERDGTGEGILWRAKAP